MLIKSNKIVPGPTFYVDKIAAGVVFRIWCCHKRNMAWICSSVTDPERFDMDPDPTFYIYADPDHNNLFLVKYWEKNKFQRFWVRGCNKWQKILRISDNHNISLTKNISRSPRKSENFFSSALVGESVKIWYKSDVMMFHDLRWPLLRTNYKISDDFFLMTFHRLIIWPVAV